jgi:ABC-type glycerol-3-phosphate transport system substrate-binding protein
MALGGRWWLVQLRLDIRDRGFKLASVEPPVGKTDRLSGGGTRAVMINSKGKNRDQAVEFALYLLGEDYNFLLNDQGDALSGVRDFAYTDRYLRPPDHPDEDFHEAFRASLERGVMSRNSPFISVNEFDTILNPQLDLVKLNQKPAGLALRDAARKIEATMKRNIERDPELKQFYLAAGGAR